MQNRFLYLFLLPLFATLACNKPDTVGLEVQPESDDINLGYVDTSTIVLETNKQDSLRADENFATQKSVLLGNMNDDVFGTTTASLYAQLKPSGGVPVFSNSRFDSLVLCLAYKDFYGDTTVEQKLEVYEVTETMVKDSNYFSNKTFSTDAALLGSLNFLPQKRTDSIDIGGTKYAAHIRIPITNAAFASKVYDYADNDAFVDNIKGIYIKALPVTGKGGIVTFSASSVVSAMILYFTEDTTASNEKTLTVTCPLTTDNAMVSNFIHDYTTATMPITFDDAFAGADKCYLQGIAGPKVKVTFPYLKNFALDAPVAINKAELVITTVPGSNSELAVLPRLGLAVINADGTISNLPDVIQGTAYFGGSLYNSNQYRFNIAHYAQQILYDKRTDYGLYLLAAGSEHSQYPQRTIIAGQNNADASVRIKLQISFTRLTP